MQGSPRTWWFALTLALGMPVASPVTAQGPSPPIGDAFWSHWGDGKAELAAYDLTVSRYGETREGVAVAIFVTETFSNSLRVKADPGRHPESDEFGVIKLNLVEDFPTGVYDYNLMTSAFVALEPVNGLPLGATTKVSFSSQEWCGHVYQQMLLDGDGVRLTSHSYFDGEADQERRLEGHPDGLAEDALLLWARGLAYPALEPGESREIALLRSARMSRLAHVPAVWENAVLFRSADEATVRVPAGEYRVHVRTVEVGQARSWSFYVESAWPHRIVQWESSEGQEAVLVGAERMAYWKLNGPEGQSALARLGLDPRGRRTP